MLCVTRAIEVFPPSGSFRDSALEDFSVKKYRRIRAYVFFSCFLQQMWFS